MSREANASDQDAEIEFIRTLMIGIGIGILLGMAFGSLPSILWSTL